MTEHLWRKRDLQIGVGVYLQCVRCGVSCILQPESYRELRTRYTHPADPLERLDVEPNCNPFERSDDTLTGLVDPDA